MTTSSIDDIDSGIIALVEEDGRRSNRDIARILSLSEKQVGVRIRRLLQQDVMRIIASVDVLAAGFEFMLTVGVEVAGRAAAAVAEQLAVFPEVLSVLLMSGPYDIEIVIVARDYQALVHLLKERLSRVKGIGGLSPSLRLETFKFQPGMGPLVSRPQSLLAFPENSVLDKTDQAIVRELWKNARATNQEIATTLETSESTVRSRVGWMKQQNVVRITAINNLRVGEDVVFALIGLQVDGDHQGPVAKQLCAFDEVKFVATVLGRYDILAIAIVDNAPHLSEVLHERIAAIGGVRSVKTSQALRVVKYDHHWTLVK